MDRRISFLSTSDEIDIICLNALFPYIKVLTWCVPDLEHGGDQAPPDHGFLSPPGYPWRVIYHTSLTYFPRLSEITNDITGLSSPSDRINSTNAEIFPPLLTAFPSL